MMKRDIHARGFSNQALAFGMASGALAAVLAAPVSEARACGCFAPPDPSVPVVQAGERILFWHEEGQVNALIQIQYQGDAQEFGWLLPLPAVPEMELGTDEAFAQLINATQPKYRLVQNAGDSCDWVNNFAFPASADSSAGGRESDDSPLVLEDSIGPYDYAVLRADSRDEMFDWLTRNSYFIPTGTEDVVGPYIREGGYFLALRLRKGNDAGDIQPVLISYDSDLPMIPIILTSVAANPDMGVQVWVLGEHRAIPRNYRHTVLNLEHLDWFTAGQNYNDVVIKAVDEAEGHHSFITEYAGTSGIMQDLLYYEGRFGTRQSLEQVTDHLEFLNELRRRGFPWSSQLKNILKGAFPYPETLATQNIDEEQFYDNIEYYLGYFRERNPEYFVGYEIDFDAVALTADLFERIVIPTLKVAQQFERLPYLTRLYTTLSPEEMTKDPVFSFNPDLEDVSNVHEATMEYICDDRQNGPNDTPGILTLPDGRKFYVRNAEDWQTRNRTNVPYSSRIEMLREEGNPEVEIDNAFRISPSDMGDRDRGCACTAEDANDSSAALSLALVGLLGLGMAVRRRRS